MLFDYLIFVVSGNLPTQCLPMYYCETHVSRNLMFDLYDAGPITIITFVVQKNMSDLSYQITSVHHL